MPAFKLFTGNYLTVLENLGMPLEFAGTLSPAEYENTIAKDLDRMRYINYRGTVAEMKATLADHSSLSDEQLSYTQGDFFAGVFSQIKIGYLPKFASKREEAIERDLSSEYSDRIDFHYVDDDGVPCGFSIEYLIDDQDKLPLEQRQRPFAIAIIKGVTNAAKDRQVTYISHATLLHGYPGNDGPMLEKNGQDLESDQVQRVLHAALNSKPISTLLHGILQGEDINRTAFLALDTRIKLNANIDDRDPKLALIFDLYVLRERILADAHKSSEAIRLGNEIREILNATFKDVHYFKDKTIGDVETLVRFYQQQPALANIASLPSALNALARHRGFQTYEAMQNALNQSFLQRNLGNLILLSVAVLTTLSFFLVMTGTLAALGFVLLPSLPLLLTEFGLGTAGALTTLTCVNLFLDEMDTNTNRVEIQQEVDRLTATEKQELAPLHKQFQASIESSFRTQKAACDETDEGVEPQCNTDEPIPRPEVMRRSVSESELSLGRSPLTTFGKSKSIDDLISIGHVSDTSPDLTM